MYQSKYYTCEEIDERLLKGYYDDAVSKGYPGTLDQFKLELASQDAVNLDILNNYAGYTSTEAISKINELYPTISHPLTFVFLDKTYNRERRFKYKGAGPSSNRRNYSDNSNYIFTLDELNGAEGATDIKNLLYEISSIGFSGSAIIRDGNRGYYCGQLTIFGDNMGHVVNQVLLTNNILSEDGTTITTSHNHTRTFQYERFLVVSGDSWVDREGNPVARLAYSKWYLSAYDQGGRSTAKVVEFGGVVENIMIDTTSTAETVTPENILFNKSTGHFVAKIGEGFTTKYYLNWNGASDYNENTDEGVKAKSNVFIDLSTGKISGISQEVGKKLDAPEVGGTKGQVLSLDENGNTIWKYEEGGGGYHPPVGGIPKTDLAEDVQSSLNKADTALQEHQDISGLATKGELTEIGREVGDLKQKVGDVDKTTINGLPVNSGATIVLGTQISSVQGVKTALTALVNILRKGVYTADTTNAINGFASYVNAITEGDSPSPAVKYTITNNLTNCFNSNDMWEIDSGSHYRAIISAKQYYELKTVIVTMGDIVVDTDNGVIDILGVTGDIVITAIAELSDLDAPIPFEDSETKAICVQYYDTNKDGELSFREAKGKTGMLGNVYSRKTFTKFNELQYFGISAFSSNQFDACSNLEEITLPSLPKVITKSMFNSCSKLKTIVIPEGYTEIGVTSFQNSSILTIDELPSTISRIGNYAFSNTKCNKIKLLATNPPEIFGSSSTPTNMENVFPTNCIVYVPDESLNSYLEHTIWKTMSSRIKPLSEYE